MRILHTSDWHLGKRLFKLDRAPEHELFLSWLLETLVKKQIDLLIIAGDVFDTPTPPHQSLEMFYRFLSRVSQETTTETMVIAGNHDSGVLLEAPAQLLGPHRVKIWGKLSKDPQDHWMRWENKNEAIDICALPFFRSYELIPQGEGEALKALTSYLTKEKTVPQILILHHLAGMFEAAGSEQVISLSGVDSIPVELLKGFDYVALGHIHKPQKVSANSYYSGSPIPLRFSETLQKSVVLLEGSQSGFKIETCPVPLFRALKIIKATELDWREKIQEMTLESPLTPMIEMQMTLSAPQVGLVDDLRKALESKKFELLSYLPTYSGELKKSQRHEKLFELSPLELFEEFYSVKYPESPDIPSELKDDFKMLLEKVKHAPPQT